MHHLKLLLPCVGTECGGFSSLPIQCKPVAQLGMCIAELLYRSCYFIVHAIKGAESMAGGHTLQFLQPLEVGLHPGLVLQQTGPVHDPGSACKHVALVM